MRSYLLYSLFFLSVLTIRGQKINTDDSLKISCKKNSIYIELGGQGGIYSIGYDCIFDIKEKTKNSFSIGFSYVQGLDNRNIVRVFVLPFSRNTIYFRYLELGLGLTPAIYAELKKASTYKAVYVDAYTEITPLLFLTPKLGFRYQKNDGGFFFRAALTPMFSLISNSFLYRRVYPWAGLSFGKTF